MKKKILLVASALSLIGAGVYYFRYKQSDEPKKDDSGFLSYYNPVSSPQPQYVQPSITNVFNQASKVADQLAKDTGQKTSVRVTPSGSSKSNLTTPSQDKLGFIVDIGTNLSVQAGSKAQSDLLKTLSANTSSAGFPNKGLISVNQGSTKLGAYDFTLQQTTATKEGLKSSLDAVNKAVSTAKPVSNSKKSTLNNLLSNAKSNVATAKSNIASKVSKITKVF